MLKLYVSPSCSSCRKVKKYFDENGIKYIEKNIFATKLTRDDIFRMVYNSENGFEDIISTRSKIIKDNNIDLNSMKTSDLVDFIIKNPSILKRPIIVADDELQVGYNADDISLFLPLDLRDKECFGCDKCEDCAYDNAISNIK